VGWFSGPTVRERSNRGRVEYYGKCDECSTEKSGTNKRDVEKALERCERDDKRAKEKAREQEVKDRAERARKAAADKEAAEAKKRQEEAERIKKKLLKTARQKRRDAKGKKCAFCKKQPCAATHPSCAMLEANRYESAHNMDVSDPATFYDWAKQWKNM
jgi:hypothetical protein